MPELPQLSDTQPILKETPVASGAEGLEAFAKTLGQLGAKAEEKAVDYEEEASHAQLLQSQGMLSDLEFQTKVKMLENPGMSKEIGINAAKVAQSIKESALLNKKDRLNFNYLADNSIRDMEFEGVKNSIQLSRETAKFNALTAFDDAKQQIYENLFRDPKAAEIAINSTYKSLEGYVASKILTPSEAATLHHAIAEEIKRAEIRGAHFRDGKATAADINAVNSYQANPMPYDNASLPMTASSEYHADSYLDHMSTQDIRAAIAQGNNIPASAMMYIKDDNTALSLQSYKWGAAQAQGKIAAGRPWQEIKQEAANLNSDHLKLNDEQEGYRDRLNNYIAGIEKFGKYPEYIAQTPKGARAYLEYNRKKAALDNVIYSADPATNEVKKQQANLENLNNLFANLNAVGIGIDIPDQYRTPVPKQYTQPIQNAFEANADISQGLNMIGIFDRRNLPYAAAAMKDPRQQLTVYSLGKLRGYADAGFLTSFMKSQQDGIDYSNLQTDKSGYSNEKLKDMVNPAINQLNDYLSRLPNGNQLVSAQTDQAIRYVKYMALTHNDPTFSHVADYLKTYSSNMGRVFSPISTFNYLIDNNVIPVSKSQADKLAGHALNVAYTHMRGYMNEEEFKENISRNPPFVISTPTGRVTVVDQYGRAIADKNGHAAFDEFYTEGLQRHADRDDEALHILTPNNPFILRPKHAGDKPPGSLWEAIRSGK